jgi:hypothetical protein
MIESAPEQFRKLSKREATLLYVLGPAGWLLLALLWTSIAEGAFGFAWLILLGVYTALLVLLGLALPGTNSATARKWRPLIQVTYWLTHVVFTSIVALLCWLVYWLWEFRDVR